MKSVIQYLRYFIMQEFVQLILVSWQGIDIRHKGERKVHRTEPKSQDIYLRLLVKVGDDRMASLFVLMVA